MTVQTDLWDAQVADIITLTNRPELDAETQLAVRAATLRAHLSGHFVRDVVSGTVVPTPAILATSATLLQAVTTAAPFARFRDVSNVQVLDVDGNVVDGIKIELVEPQDIWEYGYVGVKKPYVAWLAGTNLNIYCAAGLYGASVDWFQSPNITRATYDSWIAQNIPDIIVWEGARTVWNRTGNQEKAKEAYDVLHGVPGTDDLGLYQLLYANFGNTAGR